MMLKPGDYFVPVYNIGDNEKSSAINTIYQVIAVDPPFVGAQTVFVTNNRLATIEFADNKVTQWDITDVELHPIDKSYARQVIRAHKKWLAAKRKGVRPISNGSMKAPIIATDIISSLLKESDGSDD
jgi:hypothetical protein